MGRRASFGMLGLALIAALAAVLGGTGFVSLAAPIDSAAAVAVANELPGITEIGCGYDVNGQYASSLAVKIPLFDLYKNGESTVNLDPQSPSSTFRIPKSVTFHPAWATEYTISSGNNATEISNSLSVKVGLEGKYGPFSASVSTDFAKSTLSSTAFTFSRVQYNINLYTLQLGARDELKGMLTQQARADINSLDPVQLFDTYGAYFLSSFAMGGRSVVASSTSKYSFASSLSVDAVAKVSGDVLIGSAGGNVDTKLAKAAKEFREASKVTVTTKGGDSQFGSELPAKFREWSQSVKQFPLFVDFLDDQSLQGIWTLADSKERADLLKNEAIKYLTARVIKIPVRDGPVLQGKWVPLTPTGNDQGSGAHMKLFVYRPQLGRDDTDWNWLSQTAFANENAYHEKQGLAVRELVAGVLGDISDWYGIWDDRGSVKINDYNLWHPVPGRAVNYEAMGSFFRGPVKGQVPPPAGEAAKLKALHKSFVAPVAAPAQLVWTDKGTWARKYGSVWRVPDNAEYISWGGLVGSEAYDYTSVPRDRVHAVKKSAITFDPREVDDDSDGPDSNSSGTPQYVSKKKAPGATLAAYIMYRFEAAAERVLGALKV